MYESALVLRSNRRIPIIDTKSVLVWMIDMVVHPLLLVLASFPPYSEPHSYYNPRSSILQGFQKQEIAQTTVCTVSSTFLTGRSNV